MSNEIEQAPSRIDMVAWALGVVAGLFVVFAFVIAGFWSLMWLNFFLMRKLL